MSAIGGTSNGVHESQSRLWENHVGRSAAFWRLHFPTLQAAFPEALTPDVRMLFVAMIRYININEPASFLPRPHRPDIQSHVCVLLTQVSWKDFHAAINAAEPGLIRVEADELTYDFHIMLRTELEAQLLTGELAVADVPAAWNAGVKELLGVDVPDDARGCLQVRKTVPFRLQSMSSVSSVSSVDDRIRLCLISGYTLVWWIFGIVLQLHYWYDNYTDAGRSVLATRNVVFWQIYMHVG